MEGRYYCSKETLKELKNNEQIVFQYCSDNGNVNNVNNPNGSIMGIAGIINLKGNVLGMMPHPERCSENLLGGENGIKLIEVQRGICDEDDIVRIEDDYGRLEK